MEKDGVKTKQNQKSRIDEVMGIISFIIFIAAIPLMIYSKMGVEFFILITAAIFINFCIRPFISYKKIELCTETEVNSFRILRPCLIAATALEAIFILYKVIFSQSIICERGYVIYNFIAIWIIFSVIAIQIINFIDEVNSLRTKNSNFMKHVLNVIALILSIITIVIIPVSKFFMAKKVVDFSTIKMPSEFVIFGESDNDPQFGYAKSHEKGKITDVKFMDLFKNELSNTKSENIRDLDRINYEIRNTSDEYITLYPTYTNTRPGEGSLHGIDDGYIYEIRVHKNGDIVLVDYNIDNNNFLLGKPNDIYRLNLSKGFVDKLKSFTK